MRGVSFCARRGFTWPHGLAQIGRHGRVVRPMRSWMGSIMQRLLKGLRRGLRGSLLARASRRRMRSAGRPNPETSTLPTGEIMKGNIKWLIIAALVVVFAVVPELRAACSIGLPDLLGPVVGQ